MSESPEQSRTAKDSKEEPATEDSSTPKEQTEAAPAKDETPSPEELLALERKRVEELETKLVYQKAEHANAIKAMERRRAEIIEQANRGLLLQLLPVLDDLELSLLMVPMTEMNQSFIEGLQMVLKGFKTTLKSAGVTPIECEGKPFDPLRHEVLSREKTTDHPPHTILEELRKGYLLKGKLLRTSLVKIAVAPKPPGDEAEPSPEDNQ
jgi:molecular chaperone GrpE